MSRASALILLAHGSRAPQTRVEIGILAAKLQTKRKGLLVKPAFLGLIRPGLSDALEEVADQQAIRVHILPLFLFTGKHVLEDIPALLRQTRVRHPGMKLVLLDPIGMHARFPSLVLAAGSL